eukprot:TRINITY_DN58120_c0_g2_i1.p1 TRINITY_DN58120_c0_g2~~TRINITY_DN58120_c0_g2_i1.p1  ORF type:complete len:1962 (-),score=374.00 TRINITY_DN58120_c0_g2_i1:115-6000(-)
MEARSQVLLCQEIDSELRELCLECKKKFPIIKEYTERAVLKVRHHRDAVELLCPSAPPRGGPSSAVAQAAVSSTIGSNAGGETLPEFPLDEVLRAILMACETFQTKIVLLSLSCLQRLIHRRVLKEGTIAIVINLMKEQATNGDESVQLKVLQTIMATPAHMTLLNELVVEQLMQLLYVLHNSASLCVHHTACAGLRQLAEHLADRAAASLSDEVVPRSISASSPSSGLAGVPSYLTSEDPQSMSLRIRPVITRSPATIPTVMPGEAPATLNRSMRMFYVFVQDLCVMADYDASTLASRYATDAGERMRTGSREGYWLSAVKFPRPLCLELLGTCVATHPEVFLQSSECFALLRHNICAVLLKNLRGCFDFAILIRSIHLLQQILKLPALAALLMPELQVFLHLMLDLTTAERSAWQRATALEFLKTICDDPACLAVLYEHGAASEGAEPGSKTFVDLVNSLSKLMHQVCFSSGMDSGALLQTAASSQSSSTGRDSAASAPATNASDKSLPLLLQGGVKLLGHSDGDRAVAARGGPNPPAAVSTAVGSNTSGRSGGGAAARQKLLLLMSEAEPPPIQPAFLVSLVVDCVFGIVSTLYRFLVDAGEAQPGTHSPAGATSDQALLPLTGQVAPSQQRCRGMLSDCWAPLLSALSLLQHGSVDEALLQQALRCLQTMLFCCGRLGLEQARDACLSQLARYVLPGGSGHDMDAEASANATGTLVQKNVVCFQAFVSFCYSFGSLLGVAGWATALKTFTSLERLLQRSTATPQALDPAAFRQALDALWEHTAQLPDQAVLELLQAMGNLLKMNSTALVSAGTSNGSGGASSAEEGPLVLARLVDVCSANTGRLLTIWPVALEIILAACLSPRADLRGAATMTLCRIPSSALRRGALGDGQQLEMQQQELLKPLERLLDVPYEDARARLTDGLLAILQESGQELTPGAWGTTIKLVAAAARVELEKAGMDFYLAQELDRFAPGRDEKLQSPVDNQRNADADATWGRPSLTSQQLATAEKAQQTSTVLPVMFQLLELLVHDFMEYVPPGSVPPLTASIGAFARFTGLGVNSSLTAVGFLWNVADALARYHSSPAGPGSGQSTAAAEALPKSAPPADGIEELWLQIFIHLRVLAVDARPEVRNCAVKSLTSALLSHGRKVGPVCYKRCLQEILVKVLGEIQDATGRARDRAASPGKVGDVPMIVHHSRDSPEKQWAETMVLGLEGVRRVLSHYAEEAGVVAFAPLAYSLLLQVQSTLRSLNTGTSGSALRALVDLMRIPASSHSFEIEGTLVPDQALPIPASGLTSVWLLAWSVLQQMVPFCMAQEVPESLMETFSSTLGSLRTSHRHLMTPAQHMILVHLATVLVTSPSFSLPVCQPIELDDKADQETFDKDPQELLAMLQGAVSSCSEKSATTRKQMLSATPPLACAEERMEQEVFDLAARSPEVFWNLARRFEGQGAAYSKAAVPMKDFVDENRSRNLDTRSLAAAVRDIKAAAALATDSMGNRKTPEAKEDVPEATPEDLTSQFFGPGQSPTHRTMLHICTARLQHVQGFVFNLLEEMPAFEEPLLQVFFLFHCCASFLNVRRMLLDTNKLALAARTLCLLVLFCRRIVLIGLTAPEKSGSAPPQLEALLAAFPSLLRVVVGLAAPGHYGGARPPGSGKGLGKHQEAALHACGMWRIATETVIYLIEDTLPVIERTTVSEKCMAAYWTAAMDSLSQVVTIGFGQARAAVGLEVLAEAVSNLLVHRILVCPVVPQDVLERAVGLLSDLAGLQSHSATGERAGSNAAEPRLALGHLFALCSCASGGNGDAAGAGAEAFPLESSAALAARGRDAAAAPSRSTSPLLPARRAALLAVAAPQLLKRVKAALENYAKEAAAATPGKASFRVEEVRFILSKLKAFRADDVALSAAQTVLPSATARDACRLSGPSSFAMALLPQLAALTTSGDPNVARDVREILEAISSDLGL